MGVWETFKQRLRSPLRQSGGAPEGYDEQYGGVAPQSQYDLPGFQARDQGLSQFAESRGGGPFRGQQQQLGNMLMQQARGANSYSKEDLRQSVGRLQAQQQGLAAGARPANSAMATRMAMQNSGNLGAQLAGQQAMAGIAERNAAAQSAGGVLQGARGQDTEAYLGAQNLGLQNAQLQQAGQIGREQIRANRYGTAMNTPSNKEAILGALQGAGQAMMGVVSGIEFKKNVRPGETDVDQAMRGLQPRSFNYNDKARRELGENGKKNVGFVAEELEKTAPGVVKNTPSGKMLDGGKMAAMALAGASQAYKKIDNLYSMLKAAKNPDLSPGAYKEMDARLGASDADRKQAEIRAAEQGRTVISGGTQLTGQERHRQQLMSSGRQLTEQEQTAEDYRRRYRPREFEQLTEGDEARKFAIMQRRKGAELENILRSAGERRRMGSGF